jgi:hypothetical protein
MRPKLMAFVLAFCSSCLFALPAAAASLVDYFGTYVGVAEVRDAADRVVETRHMDIVIKPFRRRGFTVHWVNVTLVDGRRDLPGVERRLAEVTFEPQGNTGLFVEAQIVNPFAEREEMEPMAGDPLRWAKLDDAGLHVFSFVVLPNGRYELQTYTRRLTDVGLDLVFERVVDGNTLRRIDGRTVRAD